MYRNLLLTRTFPYGILEHNGCTDVFVCRMGMLYMVRRSLVFFIAFTQFITHHPNKESAYSCSWLALTALLTSLQTCKSWTWMVHISANASCFVTELMLCINILLLCMMLYCFYKYLISRIVYPIVKNHVFIMNKVDFSIPFADLSLYSASSIIIGFPIREPSFYTAKVYGRGGNERVTAFSLWLEKNNDVVCDCPNIFFVQNFSNSTCPHLKRP